MIHYLTKIWPKRPSTPVAQGADADISQRINLLRGLLIFGIILIHTHPVVPLMDTGSSVFDFVKAVFQHAIFRCSVPVLTCISGYLLFQACLDLRFRALLVKKLQTLLIPMVVFNILVALILFTVQINQIMDHEFARKLYPFETTNWVEAIFGLNTLPVNYPLGFLRDLFVVSLLAPLAGLMIRNFAWTGLVLTTLVFWLNLDGNLVLRSHMPTAFYIGGMAAIWQWDLKRLDKYALWLLLALVSLSLAIVALRIENTNFLRLIAPFLIWPAASLLVNTSIGVRIAKLAKYSFPAFLLHAPILVVSWIIYQKAFSIVPYWMYWIGTPIIAVLTAITLHILGDRVMPKAMNLLLGGRRKTSITAEDRPNPIPTFPEANPQLQNVANQAVFRSHRPRDLSTAWEAKEPPVAS